MPAETVTIAEALKANGYTTGHSGKWHVAMKHHGYPLDNGKISIMEGGTRVPLIITGPGIPRGVQTEVMVNGLDFYPTILSLTGTEQPAGKAV